MSIILYLDDISEFTGDVLLVGDGEVAGDATDNIKLSVLSWNQPYNFSVPLPLGLTLEQAEKQQLLWQPASPLWGEEVIQPFILPTILPESAMLLATV